MRSISDLIKIIDSESVMSEKAKAAFRELIISSAMVVVRSQHLKWLGAFATNPPARELFHEHDRFPKAANVT